MVVSMPVDEMKMKTGRLIAFTLMALLSSCSLEDSSGIEIFSINYTFTNGSEGWTADFTDYPVNESPEADSIYQWKAEISASAPATGGLNAYMVSCNNVSGDVFMFLKKKIDGLRPNTNYNVVFEVMLASNAVAGQGIILKGGASGLEPKKVIENNYYVLNIDKGSDTTSGESAISFGDIGTTNSTADYSFLVKGNVNAYEPFVARTNSKGELWLVVGTDSLFEGTTTVYFTGINLVFSVSG
jgi:hypothetical protein